VLCVVECDDVISLNG